MKKLFSILLTAVLLFVCGCDSIKPYEGDKSSKIVVSEATESSLDDYKEPDTTNNSSSAEQDNTTQEISNGKNSSQSSVSSTPESEISSPADSPVKNESPLVSNNDSSKKSDDFDGVYCANMNTKKFHKSNCGSAKLIKDSNLYTTTSRDELINDGYVPCLRCNP